jgi:predicted dienelactone hydrolase
MRFVVRLPHLGFAGLALGAAIAAGAAACGNSGATAQDAGAAATSNDAASGSDGASPALDATVFGDDASTSPLDGGGSPPSDAEIPDAPLNAVGVTTRTFIDTSRPTPATGTAAAKTSRTLLTEIWYPTSASDAGATPVRDAPLAPGGPYPLVFFVHGSSSGRLFYTFLTIGLAQAGYIVAAADFPLTALSTPGGASDLHVSDEVGDLSFLCDQLKVASADAGDALRGAVDGLSYAVVGHSTGGAVAELAAFAGDDALVTHDPRVTAVVPLSGDACMFSSEFFKSRPVPIFAIGATNDLFVRFANSGEWVFDNSGEPHLLADLIGGEHMHFTDLNVDDALLGPVPTGPTSDLAVTLQAYGDASACTPIPEAGTAPLQTIATQHALVIQLVRAYLDAELRHETALLGAVEAANNPLVVIQQ